MTDSMAVQAANYGIFNLIEEQAKDMKLYNFTLNLVSGNDYRRLEGTPYKTEKARRAKPKQPEIELAYILEEAGHTVYFTPENTLVKGMKNYDGIVDGKLAEMKTIESTKLDKIIDRIDESDTQKASVACIRVKNPSYTKSEAVRKIREYLSEEKIQNIKEVLFVYGDRVTHIKK